MKKVLLAGSALIAALSFVSAAQAADMPASPSYNWTGLYFGANAGVSWNNSSVDNNYTVDINGSRLGGIDNKIDSNQAAFTGGGLLGYNYQIDHIVLGIETDFNYLGFSDNNTRYGSIDHPGGAIDLATKGSLQTDWFGTIRGRLGYAVDNVLIYGTGGVAYGNVSADGQVTASQGGTDLATWHASNSQTNWGWTAGAGMEYGIDQWSLGVEYLYVNLGSSNFNDGRDFNVPGHDFNLKGSADYAFSTVRATVKYRF